MESLGKDEMEVLIVDDEKVIQEFLKSFFHREGHRADVANCGNQAMEKIVQKDYDLILCDLKMPKMNGFEFFDSLQNYRPDLIDRFVFTSGGILDERSQEFLTRSGRPLLMKPMTLHDLRHLISTYSPQ